MDALRPPRRVAVELRAVPAERDARLRVRERLMEVAVVDELRDAFKPARVAAPAQFGGRDLPAPLLRLGRERLGGDLGASVEVADGGRDARRAVRRFA